LITYVDFTGNSVVLGYSSGSSSTPGENKDEHSSDQKTPATTGLDKSTVAATKKKNDLKVTTDNKHKPNSRDEKTAHANQLRKR